MSQEQDLDKAILDMYLNIAPYRSDIRAQPEEGEDFALVKKTNHWSLWLRKSNDMPFIFHLCPDREVGIWRYIKATAPGLSPCRVCDEYCPKDLIDLGKLIDI